MNIRETILQEMASLLKEDKQRVSVQEFIKDKVREQLDDETFNLLQKWDKIDSKSPEFDKTYEDINKIIQAWNKYFENKVFYGEYIGKKTGQKLGVDLVEDYKNCNYLSIAYAMGREKTAIAYYYKCKPSIYLDRFSDYVAEAIQELEVEKKVSAPETTKSPEAKAPITPTTVSFVVGDSVYYKKKPELGFFTVSKILPDNKMIIKDASGKELTVNMSSYAKKGQ